MIKGKVESSGIAELRKGRIRIILRTETDVDNGKKF